MKRTGREDVRSTAARLEGLSDTLFEKMAIAVLRRQDDDCKALLHTGQNAAGRPIADPLDGFVRVPGSYPPRYILAAHTTTKPPKLRGKWLGGLDGLQGEGDLLKLARVANRIRSETPDAQFRVILSTSQRVDSDLAACVYSASDGLGLEIEIWEQSRFAGFLDHDPDGQWLRQEYLGEQAERLSLELLLEIGRRSLAQYGGEFLYTRPELWVERRFAGDPSELRSTATLRLLAGESGFGKSATAYATLVRASQEGYPVLWVPAEDLAQANSLAEAVDITLRRLHPMVEPRAGYAALGLVPLEKRLILAVDDLRRLDSPGIYLQRLAAWCRPAEDPVFTPPLVLCPVRPSDVRETSGPWVEQVHIGRMSESEAVAALRASCAATGARFDDAKLEQLSRALGCDPIALALFSEVSAGELDDTRPWTVATDVIARFVDQQIHRIATFSQTVPEDIHRVLDILASRMLRHRRLVPTWDEAARWFASDNEGARLLRLLIQDAALCRIDRTTGRSIITFRHDRVRDHLLVRALASDFLSQPADVISDRGFTFIVAEACALSGSLAGVTRLRKEAPLALMDMLRDTDHLPDALTARVHEEAKTWLAIVRDSRHELSDAERDSISGILVGSDDPVAMEIVGAVGGRWRNLVRLRHGDALAGATYCSYTRFQFHPDDSDSALDEVLTRALCLPTFVADLRELLMKPGHSEIAEGALILAGRVALPVLAEAVRSCWESVPREDRILSAALWAGLRCAEPEQGRFAEMEPLLEAWEAQPDPVGNPDHPNYFGASKFVAAAFRTGVREEMLDYLLSRARERPALRGHLAVALEGFDEPDAVEFLARTVAEKASEDSFWADNVSRQLETADQSRAGLSTASLKRLERLWRSDAENHAVRRQACRMWMASTGPGAVPTLQQVPPGTPIYRHALWHRAVHGDLSAVPELLRVFAERHLWLRVASRVWSPEIRWQVEAVMASLESTLPPDFSGGNDDVHYELGDLLVRIPAEEAEALLVTNWNHLRHGRLFIQAALHVSTPKTLALAAEAIAAAPGEADLFRYVDHAFFVAERDPQELLRHLEALEPYFGRMEERYLVRFAERCMSSGLREWAMERISPHLSDRERCQLFPTDEDLVRELEEAEAGVPNRYGSVYWIHWAGQQPDGPRRAIEAAERFCRADPSLGRFQLFADAVKQFGMRADLARLDAVIPKYMPTMVDDMKREARFVVEYRQLD